MMVLEKRLCPSAKINHTVSCNISLYRDTKEVIYQYTQNVYCCISNTHTHTIKHTHTHNTLELQRYSRWMYRYIVPDVSRYSDISHDILVI